MKFLIHSLNMFILINVCSQSISWGKQMLQGDNNPPIIMGVGNQQVDEDGTLIVPISAYDIDDLPQDNFTVVVLGSSTSAGFGASVPDSAWVNRLIAWLGEHTNSHTVENLAVGGFSTEDIRPNGSTPSPNSQKNITKALTYNPDLIIVNLPSNNVSEGIPISTTIEHYYEIKSIADAEGIPLLLTTTQPRNFDNLPGSNPTTKRHLLEEEANAVRAEFGELVIDIYDELTDFENDNRIKSIYNSGDGIHVKDNGHRYIFNTAKAKVPQPFSSNNITLSVQNLPPFATLNDNGNGTGNITFNPVYGDDGVYNNIIVTATDAENDFDNTAFQLTVNAGSGINVFTQIATDASLPSNWQDESSTPLTDFNTPGATYFIGQNVLLSSGWNVSAPGAKLQVASGEQFDMDLNGFNLQFTSLNLMDGAILNLTNSNPVKSTIEIEGDINLRDNSLLNFGKEHLIMNGGAINPGNTNGQLSTSSGILEFQGANENQHYLNFEPINNSLESMIINTNSGTDVNLNSDCKIEKSLNINQGILNSNGHLYLTANETAQAYVGPVGEFAEITGDVNIERYLGPDKVTGWYNMGTSVKGQTLTDWQSSVQIDGPWNGGYSNVRYYDEPSDSWKFINNLSFPIDPGHGFQIFIYADEFEDGHITFRNKGPLLYGDGNGNNAGSFDIPITKDGFYDEGGWNLVSNPYHCPIDWDAPGWNRNIVNEAYYVWDAVALDYHEYIDGTGTGELTNIIGPGQSFFIYASENGLLGISEVVKESATSSSSYRKSTHGFNIHLILDNGSNKDDAWVKVSDEYSNGFIMTEDAFKMKGNIGAIYTKAPSDTARQLAINAIPLNEEETILPLYCESNSEGALKLRIEQFSMVSDDYELFLYDRQRQKKFEIHDDFEYNIENTKELKERFYLILSKKDSRLEKENVFKVYPNPFSDEFTVQLKDMVGENVTLSISNSLGQIFYKTDEVCPKNCSFTINYSDISSISDSEVLFLSISDTQGKTVKRMLRLEN